VQLPDKTETSITSATRLVKRELGTSTPSESYQGGNFWLLNGKKLTDIRAELNI
jgi:hypothetical protein